MLHGADSVASWLHDEMDGGLSSSVLFTKPWTLWGCQSTEGMPFADWHKLALCLVSLLLLETKYENQ